MRARPVVMMLSLVLLFPCDLRAWNGTGHMTVALIAYRQLSDAQKKICADLLKQHPHYSLYLNQDVPTGVDADEWAFLRAAYWPDFVRPSSKGESFKSAAITHFHHGKWHYVDIPFFAPGYHPATEPSSKSERDSENILTALEENARKLSSSDIAPADRAVALAWMEHLIGDVHQPLHAGTMYSKDYPKGDMGGNGQVVRTENGVVKLHSYWDELLGATAEYKPIDDYCAIDFLASEIAHEHTDVLHQAAFAGNTSFQSWADESHRYAVAFAYLSGHLKTAPWADFENKTITSDQVPAAPPAYTTNARDVAKLRIALAGMRLAETLKQLLKP